MSSCSLSFILLTSSIVFFIYPLWVQKTPPTELRLSPRGNRQKRMSLDTGLSVEAFGSVAACRPAGCGFGGSLGVAAGAVLWRLAPPAPFSSPPLPVSHTHFLTHAPGSVDKTNRPILVTLIFQVRLSKPVLKLPPWRSKWPSSSCFYFQALIFPTVLFHVCMYGHWRPRGLRLVTTSWLRVLLKQDEVASAMVNK